MFTNGAKMPHLYKYDSSDLHVMRVGLNVRMPSQMYKMGGKILYLVQIINEVPIDPSYDPIGFTMENGNAKYYWRDDTWSHISVNADLLVSKAFQCFKDKILSYDDYTTMTQLLSGYKYHVPLVISNFRFICYRLLYPLSDLTK
jgi:hypothetical protein